MSQFLIRTKHLMYSNIAQQPAKNPILSLFIVRYFDNTMKYGVIHIPQDPLRQQLDLW